MSHDRTRDHSAADVASLALLLHEPPRRAVTAETALLTGSPAEAIVACGESRDADLVIVGSRGHRAAASALLGSVSLTVLRTSKRPVLVVHSARLHEHATSPSSPSERQSSDAL